MQTVTQAPSAAEYSRKKWFLNVQKIVRLFIKKPEYIYLGQRPAARSIILTNHEGASVPLTMEMYAGLPARFWGTFEMNKDFKTAYKYQTVRYYHGKKHWNIWLARLFCLLATPLTRLFYIGLELIPTYPDMRFKNTLTRSIHALKKNHALVIFPENSEDVGYAEVMDEFHCGFVLLARRFRKKTGIDAPICPVYYNGKTNRMVIGKAMTLRELGEQGYDTDEGIAGFFRDSLNSLNAEHAGI